MRKQMIEQAALQVANQVRAVEDSVDSALAELAELQARIMHANSVAAVGFGAAHATLEQLAAAMSNLVATRGSVVGCHAALADAKTKVPGLRTFATGDTECPPASARADLRVVA